MTGPITPEELQAFRDAAPVEWRAKFLGDVCIEFYPGKSKEIELELYLWAQNDLTESDSAMLIGWSTGWLIERGEEVHSRMWEGEYYCHLRHAHMSRAQFLGQGPTLAIAHFRCVMVVLMAEKEKI